MATHPTLLRPLTNRMILGLSLGIAVLYLLIQIYALNYRLINQTLEGIFPLAYKFQVFMTLIQGYFIMFPVGEVIVNLITAVLVGLNLILIIALAQKTKKTGNMKLTVGGTGILTLAGAGCPTCGITVLSFLGPGSSLAGVIIHSLVIQTAIVIILVLSVLHTLKRLQTSTYCKR